MKKIIVLITLIIITHAHDSLCMDKPQSTWTIFEYLNWHNSPFKHTINMCDEVEQLVKSGIDVNKKETSQVSRFYGSTPLEVAIIDAKCERCIQLLKQNGAQVDMEYITYLQQYHSNKTTTNK